MYMGKTYIMRRSKYARTCKEPANDGETETSKRGGNSESCQPCDDPVSSPDVGTGQSVSEANVSVSFVRKVPPL